MKVKRLEVYGFKSFPYRVAIPFPEGISVIVGPNGSGKSNIVDAFRWVLGEQSLKRLRVRSLEELIFSGDHGRRPAFAEVRLVLEGSEEVVIARRVYRTGEVEYTLNNRVCRLKDIQYLFLDTGVNPKGYGLIDQGEVTGFVERSPEERKFFLEELAGVSKYKLNRDEALRDLKKTKENLTRVEDLLRELEERLSGLRKQAALAEEYLRLRERLRVLSVARLRVLFKEALKKKESALVKMSELKEALEGLNERETRLQQERTSVLTELAELRRRLAKKEEVLEGLKRDLKEASSRLERLYRIELDRSRAFERESARRATLLESLSRLNAQLKELKRELDELKRRVLDGEDRLRTLKGSYEKRREELKKASGEERRLESELLRKQEELKYLERKAAELREGLKELSEEKRKLEEELLRLEGKRRRVESEREEVRSELSSVKEEVRDLSERVKGLEEAVEGLKDSLKHASVEEREASASLRILERERESLLRRLRGERIERKTLLEELELSEEEFSVAEALYGDRLQLPVAEDAEELKSLLEEPRLKGVFFKSEDNLRALYEEVRRALKTYRAESFVCVSPGFFLKPSRQGSETYALKLELDERERRIEETAARIRELKVRREGLERDLKRLEEEREGLLSKLKALSQRRRELEERLRSLEKEAIKLEERGTFLVKKRTELEEGIERLKEELLRLEKDEKRLKEEVFSAESSLKRLKELKRALKASFDEVQRAYEELRVEYLKEKERLEHLEGTKERLESEIKRVREALENSEQRLSKVKTELEAVKDEISSALSKKAVLEERLLEEEGSYEELRREVSRLKEAVDRFDKALARLDRERSRLKEDIHRCEVDIAEAEMSVEHLKREAFENYGLSEEELARGGEAESFVSEEEIEELRRRLSAFPPVNLAAFEELKEVESRYETLRLRKRELEESVEELKRVKRRLDEESRRRLLKALEDANASLNRVFRILFEGGSARLEFVGSEDPLEAGLELKVRLPGKSVRHLSMLSGGEKTLCALAVLFAFYLVKPGPFCVLDEVDAFLDEANTNRFNRLLKEVSRQSQVILVTHNPRVMEAADAVFGVTMEEEGVSKIISIKLDKN